jgi:cell wall-associated NlpC family hydrolase
MRSGCLSRSIFFISTFCIAFSCSRDSDEKLNSDKADSDNGPFARAVVNVNIADLIREPRKNTERVSQAFYNEAVEVLERKGHYSKVRQKDGYEGWIQSYYLEAADSLQSGPEYAVISALAPAYERPDVDSNRKTMIPYGSELVGENADGFLRVESSRYGAIYIALSDLEDMRESNDPIKPDSASVCREAGKFIGSPYLWGGKSFFGIDCSGLTQIVMKRFGAVLERDSGDQMSQGYRVVRDSVRAGDLLFFPHHVGLAVTRDLMVHSTGANGGVAYNSLDPESPIYSEFHDRNFITARRVLR